MQFRIKGAATVGGIEAALAEHAFEHLFIECLGWDRFRTHVTVGENGAQMELTGVAQKRGFAVFVCPSHRTVLANRGLLRDVQRKIRRSHHEHILIHFCETPRKQVWQWATTTADGRRILHREHPFFSKEPPARLLERIQGMSISFAEEEQTGLTDVLDRVRAALAPNSELNLFAKHPSLAAKSDQLAMAMKRGEPGAYRRFVEFHMPLAKHSSRMLIRWFNMDPEDAEQTAMIGLLEAAKRFDPDRGFQFSTYAGYWIRAICQRYGLLWGLSIRIPPHIFWPCYQLKYSWDKLVATYGMRDAEDYFEAELEASGVSRNVWNQVRKALEIECFSDAELEPDETLFLEAEVDTIDESAHGELRDQIASWLKLLKQRDRDVLRLRYGLSEPEKTLEEVGKIMKVTRERIRQLQERAENKLKNRLGVAAPRTKKIKNRKPRQPR